MEDKSTLVIGWTCTQSCVPARGMRIVGVDVHKDVPKDAEMEEL